MDIEENKRIFVNGVGEAVFIEKDFNKYLGIPIKLGDGGYILTGKKEFLLKLSNIITTHFNNKKIDNYY